MDINFTAKFFEDEVKTSPIDVENFVNDTLRASRKGHHIVVFPRELIKLFMTSEFNAKVQITSENKEHLRTYFTRGNRHTLSLFENSNAILLVTEDDDLCWLDALNQRYYFIGYKNLKDAKFLRKTRLLVEDCFADGELIAEILKQTELKWDPFDTSKPPGIRFNLHHGAGERINMIYDSLIKQERIVVCICDKDCYAPNETGPKFKKLSKVERDNNYLFIGKFITTPGYSVENFFSLETIIEKYSNINSCEHIVCNAKKLLELRMNQEKDDKGNCLYLFFNLKHGIKNSKINEHFKSPEMKEWLKEKYDLSDDSISDVNPEEYVFEKIGDILPVFLKSEELPAILSNEMDSDYWNTHFSDWFDPLLWYCCGKNKKRL